MDLARKKCVPCEGHETPFSRAQAEEYLKQVDGWELVDEGKLKIRKKFKFATYLDGIDFVNKVAKIAERESHHPDLLVGWRCVTVDLTTHAIGGLFENDFILAAKIDKLAD